MLLHVLIVDDEEDVLESLVPGFVADLARRLASDKAVQAANDAAGKPLPPGGKLNVKVSAINYRSNKVGQIRTPSPAHLHVHLCCEKGGSFRHALRLLKEQFVAVVVSDLRFSEDTLGSRAGRYFIEDVLRRNPATYGILYSAYQRPDGFPAERFIRKGAASNLAGAELLDRMVEGVASYLNQPSIRRIATEIGRRGLIYQSESFGAALRRLYDYADLYFGPEIPDPTGRRRPRPTLLLDGETGTGKTELAGLLHQVSERRAFPFQMASCNQLTNETFLRSALFGHVKGAYSGAASDRQGLVSAAGKGVLLLDDLHAVTEDCSVILHSFLDDGEYSHLGEDEVRRSAHAAIVATVESPKWEEIKTERELPESFLNRVEQLVLRIPPLRERPEDVVAQANAYTAAFARQVGEEIELSPAGLAWLVDFGFPGGNSRKLRDFLKGLIASNAKTTDYLDVPEVEEYATEIGLLCRMPTAMRSAPIPPIAPHSLAPASASTPAAAPAAAAALPQPAAERLPDDPEANTWRARIVRLAGRALVDEASLDGNAADEACRTMFSANFPRVWQELRQLMSEAHHDRSLDVKLFDELLRYFAVYRFGNPARAAKELGMKDNALREFIYSREQKRLPKE